MLALIAFSLPLKLTSAQDAFTGMGFPYRAFSGLPKTQIELEHGVLEVAFAPGATRLSQQEILAWVNRSAQAVVSYYGRLPTATASLLFVPGQGRRVRGTTYGYGGVASRIMLGRDITPAGLDADWVLVHELVHHGFPSITGPRNWMHEGLATYVEPIARAQNGLLSVEEVWRQLVIGLPRGQPERGDKGLDGTPTWGRTYWGGALFYLVADVEIRRRTGNQKGLQQVLQMTVSQGGNISREWAVERFLSIGARATGTDVLAELYDCLKDKPRRVDLAQLWKHLGVSRSGRRMVFDDSAALAPIRHAITRPDHVKPGRLQAMAQTRFQKVSESACGAIPWIVES